MLLIHQKVAVGQYHTGVSPRPFFISPGGENFVTSLVAGPSGSASSPSSKLSSSSKLNGTLPLMYMFICSTHLATSASGAWACSFFDKTTIAFQYTLSFAVKAAFVNGLTSLEM